MDLDPPSLMGPDIALSSIDNSTHFSFQISFIWHDQATAVVTTVVFIVLCLLNCSFYFYFSFYEKFSHFIFSFYFSFSISQVISFSQSSTTKKT